MRPDGRGLVTDLAGATHVPFRVSEAMRERMKDRLLLALPEHARDRQDYRKRINGLPTDVLMTLEALALMAEAGNHVAAHILAEERAKFGIEADIISLPGGKP